MAGGQWKLSVYDPGTGGLIHGFFIKNSQMTPDSLQTFPVSSAIMVAADPLPIRQGC